MVALAHRHNRDQARIADHVHLGMGLLLGFDQFVDLVEAGVFEIVFAGCDAGDAEQAEAEMEAEELFDVNFEQIGAERDARTNWLRACGH